MTGHARIVIQLPLRELWNAEGVVPAERGRVLGAAQIRDLLRLGAVTFVMATCDGPLKWIPHEKCFDLWKREIRPRLVEPQAAEAGFRLDDFPGYYCYLATEWINPGAPPVILFETHH